MKSMPIEIINTNPDCENVSSRVFNCKSEKLFRAWSDPSHLKNLWGLKGFTNTFDEFDFRVGGKWRFTMQSPDKGNYANECEFILIDEPNCIVWQRFSKPIFQVVATFDEISENSTMLVFKMLFITAEECRKIKVFAVEKTKKILINLTMN